MLFGPKHSTSIPSSAGDAVPLSVDKKELEIDIPNPVPDLAVKAPSCQQRVEEVDLCTRGHVEFPLLFTLQTVNPLMSPITVQLKVKVSPGQVGAVVNCPTAFPIKKLNK